ncbi:hypothetical protein LA080_011990 [Diaporthe eres]|nr:hypothetical protein LA080_011990 [Diaporthe eres]
MAPKAAAGLASGPSTVRMGDLGFGLRGPGRTTDATECSTAQARHRKTVEEDVLATHDEILNGRLAYRR